MPEIITVSVERNFDIDSKALPDALYIDPLKGPVKKAHKALTLKNETVNSSKIEDYLALLQISYDPVQCA